MQLKFVVFFQENRKVFKTSAMTLQPNMVKVLLFVIALETSFRQKINLNEMNEIAELIRFFTRCPVKAVMPRCSEALAKKCLSDFP